MANANQVGVNTGFYASLNTVMPLFDDITSLRSVVSVDLHVCVAWKYIHPHMLLHAPVFFGRGMGIRVGIYIYS